MSLSEKSLPAPALLTDISNKRFNLCNLGEELSICPPLKAGLEQSKPFHWGSSVWTHRHTEANRGAEAQRAPVNTTFPSSHTHAKRWDGFKHPLFRETFHFSYPGSKQTTSHGTSKWFLLAFYIWETLSTFLLIQVLSKQALTSLYVSSIILCAVTMENKKPQALGKDLNFDLKQISAEGWKENHICKLF